MSRRWRGRKASFHPVLLVFWCRVIFSFNMEQHSAVKTIISAAALSLLTATSLSKQETHLCKHLSPQPFIQ